MAGPRRLTARGDRSDPQPLPDRVHPLAETVHERARPGDGRERARGGGQRRLLVVGQPQLGRRGVELHLLDADAESAPETRQRHFPTPAFAHARMAGYATGKSMFGDVQRYLNDLRDSLIPLAIPLGVLLTRGPMRRVLAAAGILGDYKGSQARECNITIDDWEAMKAARTQDEESGMTV